MVAGLVIGDADSVLPRKAVKIVLLSPELFRAEGGIARIMRLYLKALCEICGADGQVTSLTLNDAASPSDRLHLYSNRRLNGHHASNRHKIRFVIHAMALGRQADWMICGHLGQLIAARLAKIINPTLRYAVVAHGIEVWRPCGLVERWALHGATRILCISEYTRRQLLRFVPGLDPARLLIVPNTLDPGLAEAAPQQISATTSSTILAVGRLSRSDAYKGFDCLIEAMPAVCRQFPTAKLRIVGTGDDLERLQLLALQYKVGSAVVFIGSIADCHLAREYAGCSLFALPSRCEGFGLVYLEAMIRGKACIGARAGGTTEVLTPETGRLVEYGDIPSLAEAIIDLLRNPCDAAVVRRHASSFAFHHFTTKLAAALATA